MVYFYWVILLKVNKYKKISGGKYIVYFDNDRELQLYEDVILKFNLLIKREVSDNELQLINDESSLYDVYYVALKSIKTRVKSIYELKSFLLKKGYSSDIVDKVIDKLVVQGYLNDQIFVKSYINNQILTTNHGPNFIKKDLLDKGIDISLIDEEMQIFDDRMQNEKVSKIILKRMKSNRNRGGAVLKNKIINDLIKSGFSHNIIHTNIEKFDFSIDKDLSKKEYDKLYKKYSNKYTDYELKRIIREKMFQKGLVYEEE